MLSLLIILRTWRRKDLLWVVSEGVLSMNRGEPVGNRSSSTAAEGALSLLLCRELMNVLPSEVDKLASGAV